MDVTLLVGLTVALVVFFSVTLISIKLLRNKGRSHSLYNMARLGQYHEQTNLNIIPNRLQGSFYAIPLQIKTNSYCWFK